MEYTIKKIIDIDKELENYKKKNEMALDIKKRELQDAIKKIKKDSDEQIAIEKKKILEKWIKDADMETEKIHKEKEEEINKLKNIYSNFKDEIVESVLHELLNSKKEG